MGTVVIRCPATGITLPTGIRADRRKFALELFLLITRLECLI